MSKKILSAVISAVMLICLAGCSDNYVMTEDDLAIQKAIEGYWLADDSTGYNEYDENGSYASLTVMEFTNDYRCLVHTYTPGNEEDNGYIMTSKPIDYTFRDKMFRVDTDGVASYAKITVSEDGENLFWITDEQTDKYRKLTKEQAVAIGIPEYSAEAWERHDQNGLTAGESNTETEAETESESGTVSENNAESSSVINPNANVSGDIDVSKFNFDRSVTLASENADIDSVPVLLWESGDGTAAIYGIYLYEKEPYIFIEHGGVIDTFEQDWLTPRRIEPIFKFDDFDRDGADELAASYYIGSGTGVSVDQLVIYKKGEDGHFTAHKFESPESVLNEKLTVEYDEENTSVTFNFDGQSVTHNYGEEFQWIKEILTKQEEAEFRFGDIVSYSFEGDKITLSSSAGLLTRFYAVGITADVEYADGKFTLTNFKLAEEE